MLFSPVIVAYQQDDPAVTVTSTPMPEVTAVPNPTLPPDGSVTPIVQVMSTPAAETTPVITPPPTVEVTPPATETTTATADPTTEVTPAATTEPTTEVTTEPTIEVPPTVETPPTVESTPTEAPPTDGDTGEPPIALPEQQMFFSEANMAGSFEFQILSSPNPAAPPGSQTFCRFVVDDANDGNPLTFQFDAADAINIASFAWDFGDGNTSVQETPVHSYAAAGTYPVTLTCTPTAGNGSPFTLTGVIQITVAPFANFTIGPSDTFVQDVSVTPVTITTVNTSTNVVSNQWHVSTSSDPNNAAARLFSSTDPTISYTVNSLASYPAVFWVHLFGTNGSLTSIASRSFVINAPAPRADFTLSPASGTSPLTVTITTTNANTGPIVSWEWDTDNDNLFGTADSPADLTGPGPFNLSFPTAGTYPIRMRVNGWQGSFFQITRAVNVFGSSTPVNADFNFRLGQNLGGGQVEVCFTNTSTGPFVLSEWDLDGNGGNGFEVVNNNLEFCVPFPAGVTRTVRLRVSDAGSPVTQSSATRIVTTTAAPQAVINVASAVTWGSTLNFTGSNSTGTNLTYAWDFNRDGVVDSTATNPSNIDLRTFYPNNPLGPKIVRLTVTDENGRTSFAEATVTINRLELTCDFSGSLNVTPGSAAITYAETIPAAQETGRTVNYSWRITGPGLATPITGTGSTINVDWDNVGFGSYTVELSANSPLDGANCTETKTVSHLYPPLFCEVDGTLPNPVYANGQTITFTADVQNLFSRPVTYQWFVNGISQPAPGGTGSTFTYTRPNSTPAANIPVTISYTAVADNDANAVGYTPDTASCSPTRSFNIVPWPAFVCGTHAVISGDISNPIPVNTSGTPTTRNYSVNVPASVIAGRTITYVWTVDAAQGTITGGQGTNAITVQWDPDRGELSPATPDEAVSVTITITNPDGTPNVCSPTQAIAVSYARLTCNLPSGDQNVVVGETEAYSTNISNVYGRTLSYTWEFQIEEPSGSGNWVAVAPPPPLTNSTLSYQFLDPNRNYRVRYSANAAARSVTGGTIPADNCGPSGWLPITTYPTGNTWQCESGLTSTLSGGSTDLNNANLATLYTFQINVDNGGVPAIPLTYTWRLRDNASPQTIYPLQTVSGVTTNGVVTSPGFTLAQLGPLGRGDYTLLLDVTNPADTGTPPAVTCARTLNLNVGSFNLNRTTTITSQGGSVTWTPSALPIGAQICVNNTSAPRPLAADRPAQIDSVNYRWTFGGSSLPDGLSNGVYTGTQLDVDGTATNCFTYSTPGTYTLQLRGESRSGSRTENAGLLTFNVYGLQSVIAQRTSTNDFSLTQNFNAIGQNINQYDWQFFRVNPDNTRTLVTSRTNQQTPTNVNLGQPGNYVAVVTGRGNLGAQGNVTAEVPFTILAANSLSARFVASQYGGIAPLEVCFTDRSVSGTPITQWEWDRDGNGTYELVYGPGNIPANNCFTYPNPATVTQVRLRVTNQGGFIDEATNVIRTYNPVEASANFTVQPQGGGNYCFQALVPTGVNVTGWNYGDLPGNTGSNGVTAQRPCHQYSGTGEYIVRMFICDSATPQTCGEVVRTVTVVPNPPPPPSISITPSCTADRIATFVISNAAGAGNMAAADLARITNTTTNQLVSIRSFQLNAGASVTITVPNQSGGVSITTTDTGANASTTCFFPPELSVSVVCAANNLPVFTVTNARSSDGPMPSAQNWTITSSAAGNPTVANGSFQLGLNQPSQNFNVPAGSNPYLTYTFTSNGTSANLTTNDRCVPPPSIQVSSVCAFPVTFTLTNTGGAMVLPQSFTITNLRTNQTVNVGATTFQLGANGTITYTLTGLDPYDGYRLDSANDGFAGTLLETRNCARPTIQVSSVCAFPVTFTLTNNGGAMLTPQSFTITNLRTNTTVNVGATTFQLGANGTVTYTLTGLDPYDGYRLDSANGGFAGTLLETANCARPVLAVTNTCAFPFTFTVTNTGGAMLTARNYTITNLQSNQIVDSGTIQLGANGTVTYTLTGLDPYDGYRFSTTGITGGLSDSVTVNRTCERPDLTVDSTCAFPIVFTVTNGSDPMVTSRPYTITNERTGATVASGTLQLGANASQNFTLTGLDPYDGYTFTTTGITGGLSDTVTRTQNCARPVLEANSTCTFPIAFTVTNTGGAMLTGRPYTITNVRTGATVDSGTIQLGANGTITYTLTGLDPYDGYRFTTAGITANLSDSETRTQNCTRPVLSASADCAFPIVFTVENTGGTMLTARPYTITNVRTGDVVDSGTIQLGASGVRTFTLTGLDPYDGYTFSTAGITTGLSDSETLTIECARPVLEVSSVCAFPIVFTVTNTGGPMLTPQSFTITNLRTTSAVTLPVSTIQLGTNASTTITLTGLDPYDGYQFETAGITAGLSDTAGFTIECQRPVLEVSSVCAFPITFTVTNTGGAMLMPRSFTITNLRTNQTVDVGATTLQLGTNGTVTYTLTGLDPYDGYHFSTAGITGGLSDSVTRTQNCTRPVLEVSSVCAFPITITVENNGGTMLTARPYTITNVRTGDVVDSGTIQLGASGTRTFTLTGLDPYDGYRFETVGVSPGASDSVTHTRSCARPVLNVTADCAFPLRFTVTNTGGTMLTPRDFTITNLRTGEVVDVNRTTIQLGASGTITYTLTGLDPYDGYRFTTTGITPGLSDSATLTRNCARPVLVVTTDCAFPLTFTVRNTGGAMLTPRDFTITNLRTGEIVDVGATTIQLAANGTITYTLTGLDPYDGYRFTTAGITPGLSDSTTHTRNCARPVLVVTTECTSPLTFTIRNTGGAMLMPRPFTVTNLRTGEIVTLPVSTLQIAANGSTTVTLTGLDPYDGFRFQTTGITPGLTDSVMSTRECPRPVLTVTGVCANPVAFTVTNTGGAMIAAQPYSVTNLRTNRLVPLTPATFQIGAGESVTLPVTGASPFDGFRFTSDGVTPGLSDSATLTQNCAQPVLRVSAICSPVSGAVFTVTNPGSAMLTPQTYTITRNGTTAELDTLQLRAGASITLSIDAGSPTGTFTLTSTGDAGAINRTLSCGSLTSTPLPGVIADGTTDDGAGATCGYTCPEFRLYHTNETGNWEIFRLDGADETTRTTDRRNLSWGEGDGVDDMAPSLSPNNEWVAFTSNRDGNWEIYIASTAGDPASVRRVTFNTEAIDTDPMWGPGNIIVFETTRNGNWDLYAADMLTGVVYPLTQDSADEINPFWSPDGSRIIYQSNAPDETGEQRWQIYELNLGTGVITRLSDGTTYDVDPQYSNSGDRIVYRHYAAPDANSVLAIMNSDGTNRIDITSADENATNPAWSPLDTYIAYQSNADGDLDVYVYEVGTALTRQISDNTVADYAPTWRCSDTVVVFTSDADGNPDIFEADAPPMAAPAIDVLEDGDQFTFEPSDDIYPLAFAPEENASREGETVIGQFGTQTVFLQPPSATTPLDESTDGLQRDDWGPIQSCE